MFLRRAEERHVSRCARRRLLACDRNAREAALNVPANKRMKLSIALAPAPRDTEEGHSACPPFGGHRALAAYPRCSTGSQAVALLLATELKWASGVSVACT